MITEKSKFFTSDRSNSKLNFNNGENGYHYYGNG